MRRVNNDERGAVAVIVAISAVALMGMLALVIDMGALYEERRELQNGADAGALAIAQRCAAASVLSSCTIFEDGAEANALADANALDGATNVDDVDVLGTLTEGSVTVKTSTSEIGGGTEIAYKVAQILDDDLDGKTVHATAVAEWGAVGAIDSLPLTISDCLFDLLTSNGSLLGTEHTIMFHDPALESSCTASNNNQQSPGNWGWLDQPLVAPGDRCLARIENGIAPGETGNDTECSNAQLSSILNKPIALPVYDQVTDSGNNTDYRIVGFAAFVLTAYHLSPSVDSGNPCGPPDTCIRGKFTKYVATVAELDPNAEYFGVKTVQLTG